jgi:hypothetical protein
MKPQLTNDEKNSSRSLGEAGFSLLAALVLVFFVAFLAAGAMHLMRYRYALLGFVAAVVIAVVIASLPDVQRYMKISSK